jgi:alpha-glucosidase
MNGLKWWQTAVFYQIYPRSFADSNADGIGDLIGATSKLDYLKDLGINAIWLSPHYPSPQFDCGYDISDYSGVDPDYGNLDNFRQFLEESHRRDIRVILDLVLNHTSDQHSWFLESRSNRKNPKRDWYIWKDGVKGGPPNNWLSYFGGPAWEYDPATGQYYYHFFFKQQPDLNWRNPEVKQALFEAVRFWLNLGVDGYRLDAIGTIYEDPDLPDHDVPMTLAEIRRIDAQATTVEEQKRAEKLRKRMFCHQIEQLGMHELLKELRSVVDEYGDRLLVGESDQISFMGEGDELHMVFNFPLMKTQSLTPSWIQQNQKLRLEELARVSPTAWPCNTLGNHDSPRVYNRYGDGLHNPQLARLSLALMLSLRGTPFLYNGEEIGMTDLILEDLSQFRDMLGVWLYHAEIEDMGSTPEEALKHAAAFTRDKNRTPMQWSNNPNAGFSSPGVETWLPVNPNYAEGVNAADQQSDANSLLHFYKRMLKVRRENPALVEGEYLFLGDDSAIHKDQDREEVVTAFLRHTQGQTCLVILNFAPHAYLLNLSRLESMNSFQEEVRLVFSSRSRAESDLLTRIVIDPFEVYIGQVEERTS